MSPTNGFGTSFRSTRSKYIQRVCPIRLIAQVAVARPQNILVCVAVALAFAKKTHRAEDIKSRVITSVAKVRKNPRGIVRFAVICPQKRKNIAAAQNRKRVTI
jgi:hypothetical protein